MKKTITRKPFILLALLSHLLSGCMASPSNESQAGSFVLPVSAHSETGNNQPPREQSPTATATSAATATPALAEVIVVDTFTRRVTRGWGSTRLDGEYSGASSDSYNVDGREGSIQIDASGTSRQATLSSIDALDVDMMVRFKVDKLAVGEEHSVSLLGRYRPRVGQYRARLFIFADGSMALVGQKYVELTNTTVNLRPPKRVSDVTYVPDTYFWLRAQITGANPTRIAIKSWPDGQAEPADWMFQASDVEPELQTSGAVSILARLPSRSKAAPVRFTFDDYKVTSMDEPQPTTTPTGTPGQTVTPASGGQ